LSLHYPHQPPLSPPNSSDRSRNHEPGLIHQPRTASRNAAATTSVFAPVYNYIHPFDTDDSSFAASVTCQLCLHVYATPLILPCCPTQRLCSTCLRRWLNARGTCPWCKTPVCVTDVQVDRALKAKVDDLDVCCVNRRQGCEWVGPRRYTLVHVAEECLMTDVPPLQTHSSALFQLSLLDSATAPSAITTLIPRGSSASEVQQIPSRYLPAEIPERVSSVASKAFANTPRPPIPFKKAGLRGSVLVPTRGQSTDVTAGDRLSPRRAASFDERVSLASDDASFTSSLITEPTAVFEDEDHLSLSLYVRRRREQSSRTLETWGAPRHPR
ncbi:hypothetical protein BDZ88DRAFT_485275, partial [Geranomyces variabilis]